MTYEFFTHRYERTGLPAVTLTKKGYFLFNVSAIREFGLDEFSFVKFGYDKHSRKVAFRFLSDAEYSASKVTVKKNKRLAVTVCANAFVNFYKIKHEHARVFPLKKEGKFIVFQLTE